MVRISSGIVVKSAPYPQINSISIELPGYNETAGIVHVLDPGVGAFGEVGYPDDESNAKSVKARERTQKIRLHGKNVLCCWVMRQDYRNLIPEWSQKQAVESVKEIVNSGKEHVVEVAGGRVLLAPLSLQLLGHQLPTGEAQEPEAVGAQLLGQLVTDGQQRGDVRVAREFANPVEALQFVGDPRQGRVDGATRYLHRT